MRVSCFLSILLSVAGASVCNAAAPAAVTGQRLQDADKDPGQWMSHGRTWSEQRFSPLTQINEKNINRLKLAWYADLNTFRGVDATPLVIDGVLYNVSAWSIVTAYDATNGKVLWTYNPEVPLEYGRIACCGPVSRGLAAWKGNIILAALDGRLIAIDAHTGKPVWITQTLEKDQPLSITGAPRVANGIVVIGNAGGDLGARGYMSAYDAQTGKQVWKFYIVPGNPAVADGVASDSIMPMAAKTWNGEWWKTGGGGNDWDAIVYDPTLDLVYFSTGNGSPHPQAFRSPGGGDNLFLASIVAVHAKTGLYAWHYQEVPGDEWDYDSTSPLILADLKIDGRTRQVIMHAPKDGFFYVLDRATGELISAKNFVPNTWATHIDMKTGRPVLLPDAHVTVEPHLMTPANAHNWNPMSYSPLTGLVYIPTLESWMVTSRLPDGQFKFVPGRTTLGAGVGNFPELRKEMNAATQVRDKGYVLAWDPVKQQEAFRIPSVLPFGGGTLVTAGNLLVQGTMDRTLAIFRADNGKKLWESPVQSVPVAGPISYSVRGKQYIAVNAGWNNAIVHGLNNGPEPFSVASARLVVFALDVKGLTLPPAPPVESLSAPPNTPQAADKVRDGALLFSANCAICHGQNAAGVGPKDLRFIKPDVHATFNDIVLGGKFKDKGMASFADVLKPEQVDAIHAFVISRGQEDWQPVFLPQPARR
jgi:quinohemoprotein ethanol dehydrogenase